MKVGYVRISTKEQNTARQDLLMRELEVERVFTDKVSGKNQERPELQRMMDFVREGDSLTVESISGRGDSHSESRGKDERTAQESS